MRLGVDIGGTFTDVALETTADELVTSKALTTPEAPEKGVMTAVASVLQAADCRPADVTLVIHGTTLVTNALIERKGAVTALFTTEGHRDAVEIGTESRFAQYDVFMSKPPPLVPRYLRLPVPERLDKDGAVLRPLDLSTLTEFLPLLDANNVESVAIGLLHSYADDRHERLVAEFLSDARPDLCITLSSQVSPEVREYERLSTACANAYVQPLMTRYLTRLVAQMGAVGMACPLFVMLSGGGLASLQTAIRFPVRLIESGPAGGALFAAHIARQCELGEVMSFDMGGTTAKICMIDDGAPQTSRSFEAARMYRFQRGSGLPLRIPTIEMVEIGAGGGSIATVDNMGRIAVGPDSAGADPGPVCYGRGGTEPAVTDADLLLGRLSPDRFAGGTMTLDKQHATAALGEVVGDRLNLEAPAAAFGVVEIVDENMSSAARVHAIESGKTHQSRALIAFGGAAPLHAAQVARKLGIGKIVIPTHAGVGSAVGFLRAPVAFEVVRSRFARLSEIDFDAINALFHEMETEAAAIVEQAAPGEATNRHRSAFMRYIGQAHEIEVEIPVRRFVDGDDAVLKELFENAYERQFSRTVPGVDLEIMTWRAALFTKSAPIETRPLPAPRPAPDPVEFRDVFCPVQGEFLSTPVYDRRALPAGATISGPAVVEEAETSTVLTSAFDATVADWGIVMAAKEG